LRVQKFQNPLKTSNRRECRFSEHPSPPVTEGIFDSKWELAVILTHEMNSNGVFIPELVAEPEAN